MTRLLLLGKRTTKTTHHSWQWRCFGLCACGVCVVVLRWYCGEWCCAWCAGFSLLTPGVRSCCVHMDVRVRLLQNPLTICCSSAAAHCTLHTGPKQTLCQPRRPPQPVSLCTLREARAAGWFSCNGRTGEMGPLLGRAVLCAGVSGKGKRARGEEGQKGDERKVVTSLTLLVCLYPGPVRASHPTLHGVLPFLFFGGG